MYFESDNRIYLDEPFKTEWANKNPFTEAFQLEGEIFRSVKNRYTLRFEFDGKNYFAKIHRGVGWHEIIKNWLQLKTPILSARNEYQAIRQLETLGVATMTPAAFGEWGSNPAKIKSFIITEELTDTVSLETFCRNWKKNPPPFALKKALIKTIATVSRTLHHNGINHRDYYICHFLFNPSKDWKTDLTVSLIDLHRTQLRKKTPKRWKVKDIAGLYFSAMGIGLTQRDFLRFTSVYLDKPIKQILFQDQRFLSAVSKTAYSLFRKTEKSKEIPVPLINQF